MAQFILFGARSTADQVLAGVDLTRKRMVVTGRASGIGLETMALVTNGAHVIGLARTLDDARAACNAAGTDVQPSSGYLRANAWRQSVARLYL
jgi:WW domain-containing oxidoreductase